ncbi:MAG TPA: polysaccharide deacetylase family protein [Gemmatimonadaceae bacterium]|nr:polysaccharide deacetylase family protein [Gemmatimonadaceae bacterium]
MPRVCITVDFEPDCPPYLSSSFRGIEEGAPALLALFAELGIRATYFTTGEVAERFPGAVRALVAEGHELGCHGVSHTAFDTLDEPSARREITESAQRLRTFAPVTSFRAPYLRFPEPYVRLLEDAAFTLDSSLAKYKRSFHAPRIPTTLTRIPASMTSSVLRLPAFIRDPWLSSLADPVVLFVHPWEFVDLTHEDLRYDCRFRTGDVALQCLREVVELFQRRGATFLTMRDLDPAAAAA